MASVSQALIGLHIFSATPTYLLTYMDHIRLNRIGIKAAKKRSKQLSGINENENKN